MHCARAQYMHCFLQITYSVPYALISTRIESLGLGQGGFFFLVGKLAKFFWEMQAVGLLILMLGIAGLSMGVLNLAIVIPQVWLPLHSFNVCQYLAPLN